MVFRLNRWQADVLLLGVAVIWGSAFVAQAWGMDHIGAMGYTGVRFLLGAALVAPLAWLERRALRRASHADLSRRDIAQIAGLGFILCAGAVLQQIGIQFTSVTNAGFLTAGYVPMVPLLGWWLFKHRPHPMVWVCALACLLGTWMLTGGQAVAFNVGDAWVLASAVPWALHVAFTGVVAQRTGAPFGMAFGQFLAVGLASLLIALATEDLSLSHILAAAGAIAYGGLLSVGVGYTGQVVAQRFTQPGDAAIILSAETVFAALFGAWLMGDRLTPLAWGGCAVILISIVVVQLLPSGRD